MRLFPNTADSVRREVSRKPFSADADTRRRDFWLLALVLAVGALLRAWYLWEVTGAPDFRALRQDMEVQDYQARAMLSGDWTPPPHRQDPEINVTPYYRPPGYPWLLAAIYWFTGGSYLAPRVFNSILGLLAIVLVYRLGRAVGDRRIGLVAAALLALYWGAIYYEGEVNDPAVFVFLIPCLLLSLRRWALTGRIGWAALAGLITGFYAIMRPNILLFGPFMAAWMAAWCWTRGRMKRLPGAWAALALCTAAVIAPVTARNWIVSGEFVPISTYFGENLLIGNSAESDGYTSWTPYLQELEGTGQFSVWVYNNIVRGLGREVGNPNLTHSEASKIFARQAMDWIRAHPGEALKLAVVKAILFWSPREITENKVVEGEKRHYPPLKYLPGFPWVAGPFFAGLLMMAFRLGRRGPGRDTDAAGAGGRTAADLPPGWMWALALGFILVYYASFMPFFVNARARHPLAPLLFLVAAYGLVLAWDRFRDRSRSRAGRWGPALLVAGCVALAGVEWIPYEPDMARWHYARAESWLIAGEPEKAIPEAERMLRLRYSYYMPFRLGYAFAEKGYHGLAARLLEAALSPDPSSQPRPYRQDLYFHIGANLLMDGRPDEAEPWLRRALELNPKDPRAMNDLGWIAEQRGDFRQAEQWYGRALDASPAFYLAKVNLARMLRDRGAYPRAVRLWRELCLDYPREAEYRFELALTWMAAGDAAQAERWYREALRLDPDHARAWNNLGWLLAASGRAEEGRRCYRRALALEPGFTLARINLIQALLEAGEADAAVREAEAGLERARDPQDRLQLLAMLGRAELDRGRAEAAAEALLEALPLAGSAPVVRLWLVRALVETDNPELALIEAERLLAAMPDEPEAWHWRARALELPRCSETPQPPSGA